MPFYDFENFPYVLFINDKSPNKGFYFLNLQDNSIQVLVKSDCPKGVCIKTGSRTFEFHFTSFALEEDKKRYNYHYRLPFFEDVISAMEEGQLTFAP